MSMSLAFHGGVLIALLLLARTQAPSSQVLQFDLVSKPDPIKPLDLTDKKGPSQRAKGAYSPSARRSAVPRKVFGVTMESVTMGEPGAGDVVVPVGDSLMKAPDNAVPLTDLTEMPSVMKEVKAAYPPLALQRRLEGKVVLELLINEFGRVGDARVIRGAGYGFDEAAVEAVRGFLFTPARIQGKIVPVRITYTYTFILD